MRIPRPWIEVCLPAGPGGSATLSYRDRQPIAPLLAGLRVRTAQALLSTVQPECLAHSQAGAEAVERALGVAAAPGTRAVRRMWVMAETLREHGLRITLDWPELAGETGRPDLARRFAAIPRRMHAALCGGDDPFVIGAHAAAGAGIADIIGEIETLLTEACFGMPPARWLEIGGTHALRDWAWRGATTAARSIAWLLATPAVARTAIHVRDDASLYARHAHWPLLRAFPSGALTARYLARMTDLAILPGAIRALLTHPAHPLVADDRVWTSRGALVHACTLKGGRIESYRIVTPEDVHFAPHGSAAAVIQELSGASRGERRQTLVRAAMQAFDPCVPYEIRTAACTSLPSARTSARSSRSRRNWNASHA
jgi:uptake hydrogenase large subunit